MLSRDILGSSFIHVWHSSLYWGKINLCDFTVCRSTEDTFLYGTAHYTGETLVYVTNHCLQMYSGHLSIWHSSFYWGNITLCDFTVCRCTEDGFLYGTSHYAGETLVFCHFTVCRCIEDTFLYGTSHYTGETLVYVTSLSADVLRTPFYMAQLIILGKN